MESPVHVRVREDGIAVLTFDLPGEKVNKLTPEVMERFSRAVDEIAGKGGARALIVRSGKPGGFIAGADIREIERISDPKAGEELAREGQQILNRLENLPFPVIAAIDGACLGGGMELALACHYRIITDHPRTVLGQPEIRLGILPGFGGTQRLPRLVGVRQGLELILTGKNIYPKKAKKIGLADDVVPREILQETAARFAEKLVRSGWNRPRGIRRKRTLLESLLETTAIGRNILFKKARAGVIRKSRGHYPAPIKALEAVEQGFLRGMERGLEIEARFLGELAVTPVCKNLIRVFFLREEFRKDPGVDDPGVSPLPVRKAGVIGAGVMGGGIAELFGEKEIPVRMKDIATSAVARGFSAAYRILNQKRKKRILDRKDFNRKFGKISGTTDYTGFANVDLVIEAVLEKMEVKKQVLKEVEEHLPAHAVFASNTSSLSLTDLATVSAHPERVAGMHFFNPLDTMPLVEVIR